MTNCKADLVMCAIPDAHRIAPVCAKAATNMAPVVLREALPAIDALLNFLCRTHGSVRPPLRWLGRRGGRGVDTVKPNDAIRQGDDFVCLTGTRELGLLTPRTDRPDAHAKLLRSDALAHCADVFGKVHSTDCATVTHGLQAL